MSSKRCTHSLFVLLLPMLAWAANAPRPSDPQLAVEIEQLLHKELLQDKIDPAILSRVRQIYFQHGIPTIALVGEQAAVEYVVLAAHEQPSSFLQRLLPALKKATEAAQIPASTYAYAQARLRQREREENSPRAPKNPELRDRIGRLFRTDQAARQRKSFDPKEMEKVDERNRIEVEKIFARYGVPTYTLVGSEAANEFITLVEHQPLEVMKKVLPALKQNVDAGQADPASFATLFDRVQTKENKPQVYGMNFVCNPEGNLVPSPIEHAAHLDERRAAIGLPPMRIYTKLVIENLPTDFCAKVAGSRHAKH